MNELKRLGKITAVVKWIHDHQISDRYYTFEKYKVKPVETPKYTPEFTRIMEKGGEQLIYQAEWLTILIQTISREENKS